MNLKTLIACLVLLGQPFVIGTASAACLDPTSFVSGYKLPLASEVRTAKGIVIGRVVSEQGLHEDPTDPDGYTAYNVTVRVITRLKGNVPDVIVIRNENTSARYPMSIGEEHLLFVSKDGEELSVNSCGNSSAKPAGKRLLKQIRAELQRLKSAAVGQKRTCPNWRQIILVVPSNTFMTNTQAHAQEWINVLLTQELPFIDPLSKQIAAGKVSKPCQCGCHGFAFEVPVDAKVPSLQEGKGLFYELAFTSNFPEEVNMLLFTDERGFLSWVDVTYGASNIGPMPEGLVPGARTGAWPAVRG